MVSLPVCRFSVRPPGGPQYIIFSVHAKVVVTIKVQKLKDKLKVRPDQVQFAASGRGVRLQAGEDRIMVRVQYGQHGAPVDRQAVSIFGGSSPIRKR